MRLVRKVVVARMVIRVYKARRDRLAKLVHKVTVAVQEAEALRVRKVPAA